MNVYVGETEIDYPKRNKKATDALLTSLLLHHGEKPEEPKLEVTIAPLDPDKVWFSIRGENVIKIEDVIRAVCHHFKISKLDLTSARRTRELTRPRQIGYYLSKKITARSLPEIGRRFNRDHTSALAGIRRIEALRAVDPVVDRDVILIEEALRA